MTDTNKRFAALRDRMKANGVDLVAIGPSSHMQWLIGFHTHADERPCLLLVTAETETFLMPALNAEGTREKSAIGFHVWSDDEGPDAAMAAALAELGGDKVRSVVLDETMRADFALLLLNALPEGVKTGFTDQTIGLLRTMKDEAEVEALKINAAIDDRAVELAFRSIRPGMSESELATIIRTQFQSEGAEPAFWIVGSGPNGAFPHHSVSERRIEEGDAIVIDIGARKDGYPSDITRMAFLGTPGEDYLKVHAIVEKAVQAALAAARPGARAMDVDAAARGVITEAGYGDYFVHRTGHGLGIDGHEKPYITATNETVLLEGNVFSIEPGIYLPGKFGVRLEEIVVLRRDGPEILSKLPRDLHVIPV
ncbi:Xaa-Pro peptidase family protein [Martelella sp. HB161492]|uniref:M24 family metallopeptidase n=1 Tax=Martelella sp. HB161492 TaxID=2720726 RepID=UPI0015904ADD|nr:Xaa-Pro peptidase family protein [Martelella sp. HB161492]